MSALGLHIDETVRPEIRDEFYAAAEQMAKYHHEAGPCWYLPAIAADPTRQGQGLGAALMKHALEACDEEGTNAYLECSNAANIPLYQRHGFEIVGVVVPGGSTTAEHSAADLVKLAETVERETAISAASGLPE